MKFALLIGMAWAAQWDCRHENNRVGVTLDIPSRVMKLQLGDDVEEEGIVTIRNDRRVKYTEYTLAGWRRYSLRIPRGGEGATEFRYCWSCGPYTCTEK